MIETLAEPGGERNPLMPGNSARVDRLFGYVDSDRAGGISMPRALDDGTVFESIPEQDATFAVAAVVSRDGRIANYELLKSERSGRQARWPARQRCRVARRRSASVEIRAGADAGRPRRRREHGVADRDDDACRRPNRRAIRVPPSVAPRESDSARRGDRRGAAQALRSARDVNDGLTGPPPAPRPARSPHC